MRNYVGKLTNKNPSASGYIFRRTFRFLSDVSYSDECRTKKAFQYAKRVFPLFRAITNKKYEKQEKCVRENIKNHPSRMQSRPRSRCIRNEREASTQMNMKARINLINEEMWFSNEQRNNL